MFVEKATERLRSSDGSCRCRVGLAGCGHFRSRVRVGDLRPSTGSGISSSALRPGGARTASGRLGTADGSGSALSATCPSRSGADTVLVFGYAEAASRRPSAGVLGALEQAADSGAPGGAVCVGAFALGHVGLLDGRRCTTHSAATDALADQFPAAKVAASELYVEDGPILTSAGSAARARSRSAPLRSDYGAETAAELARWCVIAPHRDGGQAQSSDGP
jgi:transcriptional regulator GlxA family with amidase domain